MYCAVILTYKPDYLFSQRALAYGFDSVEIINMSQSDWKLRALGIDSRTIIVVPDGKDQDEIANLVEKVTKRETRSLPAYAMSYIPKGIRDDIAQKYLTPEDLAAYELTSKMRSANVWEKKAIREFKITSREFKDTILVPRERYVQLLTFHDGIAKGSEHYIGAERAFNRALKERRFDLADYFGHDHITNAYDDTEEEIVRAGDKRAIDYLMNVRSNSTETITSYIKRYNPVLVPWFREKHHNRLSEGDIESLEIFNAVQNGTILPYIEDARKEMVDDGEEYIIKERVEDIAHIAFLDALGLKIYSLIKPLGALMYQETLKGEYPTEDRDVNAILREIVDIEDNQDIVEMRKAAHRNDVKELQRLRQENPLLYKNWIQDILRTAARSNALDVVRYILETKDPDDDFVEAYLSHDYSLDFWRISAPYYGVNRLREGMGFNLYYSKLGWINENLLDYLEVFLEVMPNLFHLNHYIKVAHRESNIYLLDILERASRRQGKA